MNGALVKPDAFASQRAFNRVARRFAIAHGLYPSPDHELVILASAAPVKPHADEPPVDGRQRAARHHRRREPRARPRSAVRRRRARAQDPGRDHQGERPVHGAPGPPGPRAVGRDDPAPVRSHRSPGPEPLDRVARAVEDPRAPPPGARARSGRAGGARRDAGYRGARRDVRLVPGSRRRGATRAGHLQPGSRGEARRRPGCADHAAARDERLDRAARGARQGASSRRTYVRGGRRSR